MVQLGKIVKRWSEFHQTPNGYIKCIKSQSLCTSPFFSWSKVSSQVVEACIFREEFDAFDESVFDMQKTSNISRKVSLNFSCSHKSVVLFLFLKEKNKQTNLLPRWTVFLPAKIPRYTECSAFWCELLLSLIFVFHIWIPIYSKWSRKIIDFCRCNEMGKRIGRFSILLTIIIAKKKIKSNFVDLNSKQQVY